MTEVVHAQSTRVNVQQAQVLASDDQKAVSIGEPQHRNHSGLSSQVTLDIRTPSISTRNSVIAALDDEDQDYLNKCVLSVISIGLEDEQGNRIKKMTPFLAETGFNCEIQPQQQSDKLTIALTNVPAHVVQASEPKSTGTQESAAPGTAEPTTITNQAQKRLALMLQSYLDFKDKENAGEGAIPQILNDAKVFEKPNHALHKSVVFMGGGTISDKEYEYCHNIGRKLTEQHASQPAYGSIRPRLTGITGGGPGIMEAPFSGIQSAQIPKDQKECLCFGYRDFIHEAPPTHYLDDIAIFNSLDVRLEAFFRAGQGMLFFPGGLGTVDEVLYITFLLLNNQSEDVPEVVFTCLEKNKDFFENIAQFIDATVGTEAANILLNRLIVNNENQVASALLQGNHQDKQHSLYNEKLVIPEELKINITLNEEAIKALEASLQESFGHSGEPDASLRASHLRQLIQLMYQLSFKIRTKALSPEDNHFKIKLPAALEAPLVSLLTFMHSDKRLKVEPEIFNRFIEWEASHATEKPDDAL